MINWQPVADRRLQHHSLEDDDQFFLLAPRRLEQPLSPRSQQLRSINEDDSPAWERPRRDTSAHLAASRPSTSHQQRPVSVVAPQVTHPSQGGGGGQFSTQDNSRRPYTLSSISSQRSRSRSPIVLGPLILATDRQPEELLFTLHMPASFKLDTSMTTPSGAERTMSQRDLSAGRSRPNNSWQSEASRLELSSAASVDNLRRGQFELNSGGDLSMHYGNDRPVHTNNYLAPAHLISAASFERRRSIYELAAGSESLPPHLGAHSDSISTGDGGHGHGRPNVVAPLEADQLGSLDEILATISAGDKLANQAADMELLELEPSKLQQQQPRPPATQLSRRSSVRSEAPKQSTGSSSTLSSSRASNLLPFSSEAAQLEDGRQQPSARRLSKDPNARRNEISNGFEIAWLEFTYSVEPNLLEDPRWGRVNKIFHKERRTILKGLSGGLKSGQLVALMGPSGAGKTCLLESISGVRTFGIGGRMCLRGRRRAQLVIVPQYDDFMPQFSVEETIIYGSRMKNPAGTNHMQVANRVIEQLGLQVCRHNNIQRCSGGQRKRVAIAQELVSKPNILILDEPTSGLDSSCCYHTMKVLRDVLDQSVSTDQPMAIVSTIHQPSAKVFKMFDLVYLLGKTGYMAYSGPPDELLPTISDVTGLECPKYSNPSDFMIELVAYDYGEEPVERLVEFERQKAAQYVRDFEKRAGLKSGGRQQPPRRHKSPGPPRRKQQAPQKKADSEGQAESSLTQPPARGALLNSSLASSLLSLSTRLTPSKSDTHLAHTSRLDQIQQRLKTSDLLNGVSHVIYQNNVTLELRKATSNDQRRHPFLWHTWVHMHRSFLQAVRDPILNNMRILIHLGFATLLVLLYGKKSGAARGCPPVLGLPQEITDPHQESMIDLADNVGYLFMCIMMITYVSLMSTVLTFPIDIKTVGKEYKNGWYGTVTYFLGRTIADLPFIVVYPVVYCLITWYLTDQAQDHYWRYFSFTGLIIMNAMNSQSFGLILGALFVNSVTAATFLGPVITIPWYLFTGFTKRAHRLAEPFKSTSKFLFTRHIFEGLLDTVYGHQRCNCSQFLKEYYELRFEEASRLGQLVSVETLSSLDYYDALDVAANETYPDGGRAGGSSNWFERTVNAASTVFADGDDLNLASLMDSNTKASSMFSFGLDFEPTCPSDYETFVSQDFRLGEGRTRKSFVSVLCMLCVVRVFTFLLVAWKIKTRQL